MCRKNQVLQGLAGFILLGCFSYLLYSSLNLYGFEMLIENGDNLRAGALARDILYYHYNLWGWQFIPAPGFFPNLLYQLLANALFQNPFNANIATSVLQVVLVTFCLFVLVRVAFTGRSWFQQLALTVFIISVYLFIGLYSDNYRTLLAADHAGNLMVTLLLFAGLLRYWQVASKKYWLWLPLLAFLGIISDRTLLVTATLPGITLFFYAYFSGKSAASKKQWLILFALLGLAIVVGLLLYLLPPFIAGNSYILGTMGKGRDWMLWLQLIRSQHGIMSGITITLLLIGFITMFADLIRGQARSNLKPLAIMLFTAFIVNYISIAGMQTAASSFNRYFIVPSVVLPAYAGYRLFHWNRCNPIYGLIATAGIAIIFCLLTLKTLPAGRYQAQLAALSAPSSTLACLHDIEASGTPLKSGLADYYDSQLLTYLSHNQYPILSTKPAYLYPWITNIYWYLHPQAQDALRTYNFIIIADKSNPYVEMGMQSSFFTTFGTPSFIWSCKNGAQIAVYKDQAETQLNKNIYAQLRCANGAGLRAHTVNKLKTALTYGKLAQLPFIQHWIEKEGGVMGLAQAVKRYMLCDRVQEELQRYPKTKQQLMRLAN